MTLQIRSYSQIASQMVAQIAALARDRLTDFTEGGVVRSILEVAADEVQRLEVGLFQGVRDGMAAGTFRTFDFGKAPATRASGLVRYSRSAPGTPITIPLGHQVAVPGNGVRQYETTVEMALTDLFVDVPVVCLSPGTAGNTGNATVVTMVTGLAGVTSVSNPAPFLNGLDQESDEDRLMRFRRYIAGLSRATVAALEGAALGVTRYVDDEPVERVTGAYAYEPFLDPLAEGQIGRVEVYIDNGSGTATQALVDLALQTLQGYRDQVTGARVLGWVAAGIDLSVVAVIAAPLDIVANIKVIPGVALATAAANVKTALEQYLMSLQVFRPAVQAELVAAGMNVDGITDIQLVAPSGNTIVAFNERVTPGVVVVNAS